MESSSIKIGQTFGNYQLERELGQGGMGTVYLAKDSGLNRHVALKILRLRFRRRSIVRHKVS